MLPTLEIAKVANVPAIPAQGRGSTQSEKNLRSRFQYTERMAVPCLMHASVTFRAIDRRLRVIFGILLQEHDTTNKNTNREG